MPNVLPITIQMGALPPNVRWTPQQLGDAIAGALTLVTRGTYLLPLGGSTEPTSGPNPWFKNDSELWVWSATAGEYIPLPLNSLSLEYFVGIAAPDATKYQFWIETSGVSSPVGSPLALKTYYNGAWTDVYANRPTLTAVNALIAAAVATLQPQIDALETDVTDLQTDVTDLQTDVSALQDSLINYPISVWLTADQTVPIQGAATFTKLLFNNAVVDPDAAYDSGNSQFVAPKDGIYSVSCELQIDNDTGVSGGMEFALAIFKNGGSYNGSGMAIGSPPGDRWYPQVYTLVQLATGDIIDFRMSAADGVDAGNVTVAGAGGNSSASILLERAL